MYVLWSLIIVDICRFSLHISVLCIFWKPAYINTVQVDVKNLVVNIWENSREISKQLLNYHS